MIPTVRNVHETVREAKADSQLLFYTKLKYNGYVSVLPKAWRLAALRMALI